ncbi:MAG TPA: glycosyltransferase [Gaiellaceae bacterium]
MANREDALPRVSIVGTAYNHESFIARSIESALAQDYPNLEIVFVDDGSTDGTMDVASRYGGRIRYVRKENGGVISAVNRLYEEATGEFLVFCGGDDELPPGRVWSQLRYLQEHPEVGLVYGDMEVIDRESRVIHPSWFEYARVEPPSGRLLSRLVRQNCVGAGGVMLRTSLVPHFHPIPEDVVFEDWWMLVRIAEIAEIHYLPEVVYRYRLHGENMNLGATGRQLATQIHGEARFRQAVLSSPVVGQVDLDALLESFASFEQVLASAAEGLGADPRDLLSTDAAAAATAAASALRALRDRRLAEALRLAIQAAAHDPWSGEARWVLARAVERAGLQEQGLPELTRRSIVAARARELVGEPALMSAFAARFSASDDVALIVLAEPATLDAVVELAERLGFAAEDAPEVIVTTEVDEPRLAASASAALGRSWPDLHGFDGDTMDDLVAVLRSTATAAA